MLRFSKLRDTRRDPGDAGDETGERLPPHGLLGVKPFRQTLIDKLEQVFDRISHLFGRNRREITNSRRVGTIRHRRLRLVALAAHHDHPRKPGVIRHAERRHGALNNALANGCEIRKFNNHVEPPPPGACDLQQ